MDERAIKTVHQANGIKDVGYSRSMKVLSTLFPEANSESVFSIDPSVYYRRVAEAKSQYSGDQKKR